MRRWLPWLALMSCRAVLGDFSECSADRDCVTRGSGLVCVEALCVRPNRPALDSRCITRTEVGQTPTLRVGSIFPVSRSDGGVNLTGAAREQAALLAAEQLNPPLRQGIRGRAIEYLACDSQSSTATAGELAEHLVKQGVAVILTAGSAETIAVSRVTLPAGILQISVSATAPELTDLPDQPPDGGTVGLLWRTSTSDTVQGHVIAQALLDAGQPRTAVIQLNDAYGQGLEQAFAREYPKSQAFLYTQGGDLTAALEGAATWGPAQLLIIGFADDAVRFLNGAAARPALVGLPVFLSDAAKSPALFNGLSRADLVEGALGTAPSPAAEPSEARAYFVNQYQQRFGLDPLSVSATANAFDAMMCVALAAWAAHDDLTGPALAVGMTRLHGPGALKVPLIPTAFNTATRELETGRPVDVDGASGPLDFDDRTGEAVGPIELWRATGGHFETVRVVAP